MKRIITITLLAAICVLGYSQSESGCISGNCKKGKGTFLFQNGDKYTGLFNRSKPHGYGIYTFKNGEYYEEG